MLTLKQMQEGRRYARDWAGKRNVTAAGAVAEQVDIDPKDHFCFVNAANSTYETVTINLPPVAQCQGGFYFIQVKLVANSKHVYILANGESALAGQDGDDKAMPSCDLDTTLDNVMLFSSGEHWYVVFSTMA